MTTLLLLAFLLGMRHALEVDHLAAVATLATRSRTRWQTVSQGAAWGLGHTLMLLAAGGACLLLSIAIPARLARGFEIGVGVMLLGLGAEVLWRVRRQNVHLHLHEHDDGTRHVHAHSHQPGDEQGPEHRAHPHFHPHPHGFPRRALLVGLVHGLAGSAALLLLTVTAIPSRWLGLAYIPGVWTWLHPWDGSPLGGDLGADAGHGARSQPYSPDCRGSYWSCHSGDRGLGDRRKRPATEVPMCLAIPGKVVDMTSENPHLALVEVAGVRRQINVDLVREDGLATGDWVLIHVGFAMSKIMRGRAGADAQAMLGEDLEAMREIEGYDLALAESGESPEREEAS